MKSKESNPFNLCYRPEIALPTIQEQVCKCGKVMNSDELYQVVVWMRNNNIFGIQIPIIKCACGRYAEWQLKYKQ